MNKLMQTQKKIEKAVVGTYYAIENGVVSGYRKIEDGVVGGYQQIEKHFVDAFLTPDEAVGEGASSNTGKEENE